MVKQKNLHSKDELIIKNTYEIEKIQDKIQSVEEMCKDKDPSEQEKLLRQLNEDLKKNYFEFSNQTIDVTERKLVKSDYRNTYCNNCKENCHSPCNCWFTSFGRCRIFEIQGCLGIMKKINNCEHCSHSKEDHGEGNFIFQSITEKQKVNNEEKIKAMESKNSEDTQRIQKEIDKKKGEQQGLQKQINELNEKKMIFENERQQNLKMKENIKMEIEKVSKEILLILVKLQKTSIILESKALNNRHIKNQNDYIDSLKEQLNDIGDDKDEKEKIKKLNEIKKINNAFLNSQKINLEELKDMDNEQLTERIQNYVFKEDK